MFTPKYITGISTCLCLLISSINLAQTLPDIMAIPKPYAFPRYFESILKDPVKQVSFITRSDIENGLTNDTTRIYYYNTEMKKIREISYAKNKPYKAYHFKYEGSNLIEWDEEDSTINKGSRQVSITQYNDLGLQLCSNGFYLQKNDTINRTSKCFEYDSLDNITKMTNRLNNYIQSYHNYYYSVKRLTRHDVIANPANNKNYQSTEYTYTEGNLLKEKNVFNIWNGKKTLYSWNHYYYQDSLLVKETYPGWASSPGETTVQYWYNNDKSLSRMLISKDSLYKDVAYEYGHNKVKKISARSNAWNYLNGEFLILLNSVNQFTKMPYLYEEQFSYDAKGYITEKKILLNGNIVKILEFKIEYY